VASVFWDVDNSQKMRSDILREKRLGLRDQVSFLEERDKRKKENIEKLNTGKEKENKRGHEKV
jgi:hypothetical protein